MVTTWGESHGQALGAVISGCPAGISLSEEDIERELARDIPDIKLGTIPKSNRFSKTFLGLFKEVLKMLEKL